MMPGRLPGELIPDTIYNSTSMMTRMRILVRSAPVPFCPRRASPLVERTFNLETASCHVRILKIAPTDVAGDVHDWYILVVFKTRDQMIMRQLLIVRVHSFARHSSHFVYSLWT